MKIEVVIEEGSAGVWHWFLKPDFSYAEFASPIAGWATDPGEAGNTAMNALVRLNYWYWQTQQGELF